MSKKKIHRAGLIPYYISDNNIHMLFMRPSDPKFGEFFFQCIKGKIEEGESSLEAAIREAQEEAGLFPPNIEGEPHYLGKFLGRTDIYVARIKDPDMFGDYDEETESTKWMTPQEFQKEGRDLHKPIVKAAVRYIEKQQQKEKEELKEIHLVVDQLSKRFNISDFDLQAGEMVAKSEQPLEVWKYKSKADPELLMFALKEEQSSPEDIISSVVGHFDKNDFFVIQDAWTAEGKRRQGFITSLYKTLHDKLQMSLASDLEHGPAMAQVWKKLPLKQKVFDNRSKKLIPREQISDDELYSDEEPERYRLIIEKSTRYDDFGVPGTGDTVLHEQQKYTHPDNTGKYL